MLEKEGWGGGHRGSPPGEPAVVTAPGEGTDACPVPSPTPPLPPHPKVTSRTVQGEITGRI